MRIAKWFNASRGGEHRVAVERRGHRIEGARKTSMRHYGEAMALRLGQLGVSGEHGERRVFDRAAFGAEREVCGGEGRRPAAPAEFFVLLERRLPEDRAVPQLRSADAVNYRSRADRDAAVCHRRDGAAASFEGGGGG